VCKELGKQIPYLFDKMHRKQERMLPPFPEGKVSPELQPAGHYLFDHLMLL